MARKKKLLSGLKMITREMAEAVDTGMASEDDKYTNGELAYAAASYILRGRGLGQIPMYWPWSDDKWNPTPRDHRIELAKAGALIAFEIDRLNRQEESHAKSLESVKPQGTGAAGEPRQ